MNHRYILTVLLKNLFLFKCRLPTLRLTPLLTLLLLPFALTRLICHHKRIRPPPSLFTPTLDAVVLSAFPIVWFSGFYITRTSPAFSLSFSPLSLRRRGGIGWLAWCVTYVHFRRKLPELAIQSGFISCTFRQTNIIWVLYAYASSQLTYLRFRRALPGAEEPDKLYDPPALTAGPRSSPIYISQRQTFTLLDGL